MASNIVEILTKIDGLTSELSRLEIYTFGCAADKLFQVVDPNTRHRVPFYEHFANTGDYVARIGVFRRRFPDDIPFPGNIFVKQQEGHLLGEHYLPGNQSCALLTTRGVAAREYKCINREGITPRLYSYLPQANNLMLSH